ncbi:replication initiator protein A [Vagococcus fluvialis]|uniref:replication initiator protein A n=1 Tax=Vagococcus fluvialis TaxID=2738 RepID=UPI00378A133D
MRYKINDFNPTSTFFRVPKELVEDEKYKNLSANAILAYAIYLDRFELSLKNGKDGKKEWIDSDNSIYFFYSNEKMQEKLRLGKNTVIKIKKELKKFELIEEVRQEIGKPNKIYLLRPFDIRVSPKNKPSRVQKVNTNDTEYNHTEKIKDTNKDTSRQLEEMLVNEFSDFYKDELVNDNSIKLLQNFGDAFFVKDLIDIVYKSKRKVENYNSKENNIEYKIYGDIWSSEIDKQVKKLIFKMKEYQMKDKPIKELKGYWFKIMQNFWENVLLMEKYEGITKLDFLNSMGELELKDYQLDFNRTLTRENSKNKKRLKYEWTYKAV